MYISIMGITLYTEGVRQAAPLYPSSSHLLTNIELCNALTQLTHPKISFLDFKPRKQRFYFEKYFDLRGLPHPPSCPPVWFYSLGLFQRSIDCAMKKNPTMRGTIQINGDLTRRNSELLAAPWVEAKKKDKIKVHKVRTTLHGKIMGSRKQDEHKNHEPSFSEMLNLNSIFNLNLVNDLPKLSWKLFTDTKYLPLFARCT